MPAIPAPGQVQDSCDALLFPTVSFPWSGAGRQCPAEVLEEITGLVGAGCRKIVLSGISLGLYRDREVISPA